MVGDRLDAVDDDQLGAGALDRRHDRRQRRLGGHPQVRPDGAEPLGAHADLLRALLGRDVERRTRPPRQELEQERALADARLAAEQRDRSGDDPAAEHSVELADARRLGLGQQRIDVVQQAELGHRRRGRGERAAGHRGRQHLLDEGVPRPAARALPGPLRVLRPAVAAQVHRSRLGHARSMTRGCHGAAGYRLPRLLPGRRSTAGAGRPRRRRRVTQDGGDDDQGDPGDRAGASAAADTNDAHAGAGRCSARRRQVDRRAVEGGRPRHGAVGGAPGRLDRAGQRRPQHHATSSRPASLRRPPGRRRTASRRRRPAGRCRRRRRSRRRGPADRSAPVLVVSPSTVRSMRTSAKGGPRLCSRLVASSTDDAAWRSVTVSPPSGVAVGPSTAHPAAVASSNRRSPARPGAASTTAASATAVTTSSPVPSGPNDEVDGDVDATTSGDEQRSDAHGDPAQHGPQDGAPRA